MTQFTSTIRQRGQITIPDRIRERKRWATDGSVVIINDLEPDKITIQPYSQQKETDWEKLWRDIKRVRSYKGKGGGNLSAFIAQDRESRK